MISDLNAGIAAASEEQSVVAEEMDKNILAIHNDAVRTLEEADSLLQVSTRLDGLANDLATQIRRYTFTRPAEVAG